MRRALQIVCANLSLMIIAAGVQFQCHAKTSLTPKCDTSDLLSLSKARVFADGVSGLAIPAGSKNTLFAAFERLISASPDIPITTIKTLLNQSTPSGKLYLAALLAKIEPPEGISELKRLSSDSTKVKYKSGCLSFDLSVGAVAEHILDEKSFQRFLSSQMLLSIDEFTEHQKNLSNIEHIEALSKSNSISELPKFPRASCRSGRLQIRPVPVADLETLYKKATPAGKLYLAAIIQRYYPDTGDVFLKRLTRDSTKVEYKAGSTLEEYRVAEIAERLLQTRRFRAFSIDGNDDLD